MRLSMGHIPAPPPHPPPKSCTAQAGGFGLITLPALLGREIQVFPGDPGAGAAAGSRPCGPPLPRPAPPPARPGGASAAPAASFCCAPIRTGRHGRGPWLLGGSAGREGTRVALDPGSFYGNGAITGRKGDFFLPSAWWGLRAAAGASRAALGWGL